MHPSKEKSRFELSLHSEFDKYFHFIIFTTPNECSIIRHSMWGTLKARSNPPGEEGDVWKLKICISMFYRRLDTQLIVRNHIKSFNSIQKFCLISFFLFLASASARLIFTRSILTHSRRVYRAPCHTPAKARWAYRRHARLICTARNWVWENVIEWAR